MGNGQNGKPMQRGPGVYEDLPFGEYLAIEAISNSSLKRAFDSMQEYRYGKQSVEPTPAMRFGSLCHAGKLEPLSIVNRYAVMPAFEFDPENCTVSGKPSKNKGTLYYEGKVAEFIAANPDKEIVEQAKYDEMIGMVKALNAHPLAQKFLDGPGKVELTLVWDDPETGLRCKARIDKLKPRNANSSCLVADYKTTADPRTFDSTIVNHGLHRQMAHYGNGVEVLMPEQGKVSAALVAQKSSGLYGVRAARLADSLLSLGRTELSDMMRKMAECHRREKIAAPDAWPGYESPAAWVAPHWYPPKGESVELIHHGEIIRI